MQRKAHHFKCCPVFSSTSVAISSSPAIPYFPLLSYCNIERLWEALVEARKKINCILLLYLLIPTISISAVSYVAFNIKYTKECTGNSFY
jgi:hypothetical protein